MTNTIGSNPSTLQTDPIVPNAAVNSVEVDAVYDQYEIADSFSREVANFRSEVVIPSHNELRCAGHHVLKAWVGNSTETMSQLTKAKHHCQRSMYEASDAGIMSALDMIDIFRQDYRNVPIGDIVSDYLHIKRRARDAQTLLAKGREHGPNDTIDAEPYVKTFNELVRDALILEDSREELNKIIRKERRDGFRWIGGIGIAVVLAILAHPYIVSNWFATDVSEASQGVSLSEPITTSDRALE